MEQSSRHVSRVRKIARQRMGLEEFRPGQEETILSIPEGRDTLAVMPTGYGKSAIYQVAAVMLRGPTVVISPLIALQRDQVDAIAEQVLGGAALVNSMVRSARREEAFGSLEGGVISVSGPRAVQPGGDARTTAGGKPSLFVVDEAHCISEWGHSFRPEYLRLGTVIEALGHPTVLALTATASPSHFPRHTWVVHNAWGRGLVVGSEEDKVTILFDQAGYKTLAVNYAVGQGMLVRLGDEESKGLS